MSNQEYRPGSFNFLPPIVKNLLIINVLCFLAYWALGFSMNIDLNEILGLHFFMGESFSPFQYVSYMFMHGGIWHLFFNMFALWMFGNALENYWGAKRFLMYYLITGLGAALLHTVVIAMDVVPLVAEIDQLIENPEGFSPSMDLKEQYGAFLYRTGAVPNTTESFYLFKEWVPDQPLVVGASGAVFGLLLAFGMMFPNSLIYLYFAIPIKAKYFVMLYGGLELYQGFQSNPGDNVAHFAHLGGMLFGFFLIKYWKKNP
jgi:membrane associated rhomboid family serine protease